MLEHLVVVHGIPGAGKTWLSERLAPMVGYPLLSRDRIKEALFDKSRRPDGVDELAWSRELGTLAFQVFLALAPSLGPNLMVDAHFQARFGGDRDVETLAHHVTQIFVDAPDEVVTERHHTRLAQRHAAHQPYPLPTIEDIRNARRHFAPLEVPGPVLMVDTSQAVDLKSIAEWVRASRDHPTPDADAPS